MLTVSNNIFYSGLAILTLITGAFFYKASVILLLYLVASGLAFWCLDPLKQRYLIPFSTLQHPLFWGTLLFLLYGAATSFYSLSPLLSLKTEGGFVGILVCFLILYHAPFRRLSSLKIKKMQQFFIVVFILTLLVLVEEVLTKGAGNRFLTPLFHKTPPKPICLKQAAALMALAVFPIAAFLMKQQQRFISYGLIAVVLWVCYKVYAQAAFLAVIVGCGAFLLCSLRPLGGIYTGAFGSFFLIMGTPFVKFYLIPTAFWSTYLPPSNSLYQRFLIWDFVIDRIFEKPFFGWGWGMSPFIPGASQKAYENMAFIPVHPHNNSLQIWLELGGIGAFFVAILVGLLVLQLRHFTKNPLYVSTYGALLGALWVISSSSYSAWHLWLISWVGLVCFLPQFLLEADSLKKTQITPEKIKKSFICFC